MKLSEAKNRDLKAGMLPYYISNGEVYFFFMKPSDPRYGGPNFQIAKGGVEKGDSIIKTAKKEAHEELGVTSSNLKNMKKVDVIKYDSDKWDLHYDLHIFIAQVLNSKNMDKPHYETGATKWMKYSDAIKKVRRDQISTIKKAYREISK